MILSMLRNRFLKAKCEKCKQVYNKQINLCVAIVQNAKKITTLITSMQEILRIINSFDKLSNLFSPTMLAEMNK